jgi:hypothetical protein
MPSERRQINVRADDATAAEFDRLMVAIPAALGLASLSQAEVIRLAVMELGKKYPSVEPADAVPAVKTKKGK